MHRTIVIGLSFLTLAGTAFAQGGGGEAHPSAAPGTSRLSPVVGGGQSPSQAAHDNQPNRVRASPYAVPSVDPNQPGDAASDGTAGTSSPRSPEPKPGG